MSPHRNLHLQPDIAMETNTSMVGYKGHNFYITVNLSPIQGQMLSFTFEDDIEKSKSEYYLHSETFQFYFRMPIYLNHI